MTWLTIQRPIAQLDALFARTPALNFDPELQAHWAQYLCVRCAGLLERSVVTLLGDYAQPQCSPSVHGYVQKQLKGFQNANHSKIVQLFSSFNANWEKLIDDFCEDRHRSSIGSILVNRHRIAHGLPNDLTIGRLRPWYEDEKEVIEFLFKLLFPNVTTTRR
jgi:hypothetical protein